MTIGVVSSKRSVTSIPLATSPVTSIVAPAFSPNTDAIDPIDTRNMLIEENYLSTGDDIVAIKAHKVDPRHPEASVENIVVRGNRGGAGRGISIGSGTSGGVRNILVEDNELRGAMYGIRIKTLREKGGLVQDVVFRNNRLIDVAERTRPCASGLVPVDERGGAAVHPAGNALEDQEQVGHLAQDREDVPRRSDRGTIAC